MDNGDFYNRMRRPTMEQIRYMDELSKTEKKWGAVARIAKAHNISHASVSRFFQECKKANYIDEEFELTDDGKKWLAYYRKIEKGLWAYMEDLGVPNADIGKNVWAMMEQVDSHVLSAMIEKPQGQGWKPEAPKEHNWQDGDACRSFLAGRMEKGEYRIDFVLLQTGTERKWEHKRSMGDRGFEKPALLVYDGINMYLELTPCEMQAESRINGGIMSGHLSSLSYFMEGTLVKAEFSDGKVRIPMEACSCHQRAEGRMTCMIAVTVTCSVGRVHMPESTAILVFWL